MKTLCTDSNGRTMLNFLTHLLYFVACAAVSVSCATRKVSTHEASSCDVSAPASNLSPLDTLLFDKLRLSGVPCREGVLQTVEKLNCARASTRRGGRHYTCIIRLAEVTSEAIEVSGSAARDLVSAADERFGNARFQPTKNPGAFSLEHLQCMKELTRGKTRSEAKTIDICQIEGRKSKRSARVWLNDSEVTDARELSVAREQAMKAIDQFADAECEIIDSQAVRAPNSPVDVLSISLKCADQFFVATVKIIRDVKKQCAASDSPEPSKSYLLPVEINEKNAVQN